MKKIISFYGFHSVKKAKARKILRNCRNFETLGEVSWTPSVSYCLRVNKSGSK